MSRSRFTPQAAEALREAIREAQGVEVFAIGEVKDEIITEITVTCRGQVDRVTALLGRPRSGQVVIHNHPSGDLRASDADMHLAGLYAEDGVGVVIVDSEVRRSNWVVEPDARREVGVDPSDVEAFFRERLPQVLPGFEPRGQQVQMAQSVASSLSRSAPLVVEAGTGTGKSLAYLVPAALWALANDQKVVISTHTKALQAQLLASDLPLLTKGGLEVRTAVLQGRNNYLCKRRLGIALEEEEGQDDEAANAVRALADWEATSRAGSRTDLPFQLPSGVWDRALSDSDLTLQTRCAFFQSCHYYRARRDAAGAHLVVVNHALLLVDLALRHQTGRGLLPAYNRLILDEAHHLEDAATGAATEQIGATAIRRAIIPLLDRKRRRGALSRLTQRHNRAGGPLSSEAKAKLQTLSDATDSLARGVGSHAPEILAQLTEVALAPDDSPLRITDEVQESDGWREDVVPLTTHLAGELEGLTESMAAIEGLFDDLRLDEADKAPLLEIRRARRRLVGHAQIARKFLEPSEGSCRWTELERSRRGERTLSLRVAPIEVAGTLQAILWDPIPGTTATSATLAVSGRFDWWKRRHGLSNPQEQLFPSPFDHASQCLLGLPRDLPSPGEGDFLRATCDAVVRAVQRSDGGAFVLCTSYAAVRAYADALRRAGGRQIFAQGEVGRAVLLQRFREDRRAVLVGTDSFWEGVSVQGDGLRLVIIPRLPFRVPTEPLRVARQERLQARGLDPFRAQALPEAVIKLRQGYGRLIRAHSDSGVVLLLDRRVHTQRYGRILLNALPPARRVVGPWRAVEEALGRFFARP